MPAFGLEITDGCNCIRKLWIFGYKFVITSRTRIQVCYYLKNKDTSLLLPQEQKGCMRKSRETNDLLFIDKIIMREVKMRKQNLSMA